MQQQGYQYHDNSTYITGVKPHIQSQQKLQKYVHNLDDKLDYAKWKQNIVLKYNYNPLKQMIQKVQTQRQIYRKKINDQQQRCMNALNGKVLYQQLNLFNDFSRRLQNKIKQYELQIDNANIKNVIFIAQVNDKKQQLLKLNKQIKRLQIVKLHKQGVNTRQDVFRLVRSKTVTNNLKASFVSKNNTNLSNFNTNRSNKRSNTMEGRQRLLSQSTKRSQIFQQSNKIFFNQCLTQTINSIRGMKSSQDVQNGIYLDVMGKKNQNKNGSYSLRSKICDTLITKYSVKNRSKQNKIFMEKNDFQMSWQTFNKLNWKQIMGIIMVKDRNCQKIKHLLNKCEYY